MLLYANNKREDSLIMKIPFEFSFIMLKIIIVPKDDKKKRGLASNYRSQGLRACGSCNCRNRCKNNVT